MNSTLKNFAAKIFIALILFATVPASAADNSERIRELKEVYSLYHDPEDNFLYLTYEPKFEYC